MVQGNGLTILLKDSSHAQLKEETPQNGDRHKYRYRTVSIKPKTLVIISLEIHGSFDWKDADTLFVAIAFDGGNKKFLGTNFLTQAYAIERNRGPAGEHISRYAKYPSERTYRMPKTKDHSPMPQSIPIDDKEACDKLISHSCCISIYIQRGHMQPNTKLEGQSDLGSPPASWSGVSIDCFSSSKSGADITQIHFRNTADASHKSTAAPLPSAVLKPVPKPAVSKPEVSKAAVSNLSPATKKRKLPPPAMKTKRVQLAKPKGIRDEDEDDEEVLPRFLEAVIKPEPKIEETGQVGRAGEQPIANASADGPKTTEDPNAKAKKRRELEMRLQEIELEKEELRVKKQLLDLED